MNISEKVRALIGNECNEEILSFCCEEVENYIKNYCNLSELSMKLQMIAVRMVFSLYKYSVGEMQVKSIKRGDFSVTYADEEKELFKGFNRQLFPFRRFKW